MVLWLCLEKNMVMKLEFFQWERKEISIFQLNFVGAHTLKNIGDIGKFKIISQSSIAAGVRRIEALRDKQLEDYLNNKEKLSNLSSEKDNELIKELSEQIIKLGGTPNLDQSDQKTLIKNYQNS
jgi:alanyl-tRNA synthetase